MSLIAMAVHDTPENGRDAFTKATLESIAQTVDFTKHRVFIVINGATPGTMDAVTAFAGRVGKACEVIYNQENIGTARAINKAWKDRQMGEMCIKMDNDVVIHRAGWVDEMEEAINRDPLIGIIGLKRRDLAERPDNPEPRFKSHLRLLPPPGAKWIVVEYVQHVMGTCQAYSPQLLDKIGFLCQPGIYGFDDSLAAVRCTAAGFLNCFLHGYDIDHIDPGGTPYQAWKEGYASEHMERYNSIKAAYLSGRIPVWCDESGEIPTLEAPDTITAQQPGRYGWALPNGITR